jgi:hypothetical protein
MAPKDESAMLMQRMQDSNLCPLWRLTLIKVRKGALTHRDVKNEGTSGDVYENKGAHDTMPDNKSRFWHKMHKFRDKGRESVGFFGRECTDYAIIGAKKRRPLEAALTGCEGSAGRAFAKNADLKVGATIMAAFL